VGLLVGRKVEVEERGVQFRAEQEATLFIPDEGR